MNFADFLSNGSGAAWLPLLDVMDVMIKATLVLGVASVATIALGRASAAMRHMVWTLAIVSALLLPALSIALPRWQLPIVRFTAVAAPDVENIDRNVRTIAAPPEKVFEWLADPAGASAFARPQDRSCDRVISDDECGELDTESRCTRCCADRTAVDRRLACFRLGMRRDRGDRPSADRCCRGAVDVAAHGARD